MGNANPRHRRRLLANAAWHFAEQLERRVLLSGNMLAFTAVPASTSAGSIIDSPQGVQVTVENSSGQPITNNSDSISLSLGSNPSGASLGGTFAAMAVNGVAVFTNLSIGLAANGYSLVATDNTDSTVTSAASQPFNINAIPIFNSLRSLTYGTAGYAAAGELVEDSLGNLYGTTVYGGLYAQGTVFELSGTNHATYTTLVSLTGISGSAPGDDPYGGMTFDGNGDLFGITENGGSSGHGTVFELSGTNHSTFSTLVSFTGNTGVHPGYYAQAGLTLDGNGNLYGTTEYGGTAGYGTVFELSGPNHSTFTLLASFTGTAGIEPGSNPAATLTFDNSGNLWGTTTAGGPAGDGTIFECSGPNLATFTSVVSFTGTSGNFPGKLPSAGLTVGTDGNLYGTTETGGSSNSGTIFELSGPNHSTFQSLISFTGGTGKYPGFAPTANLTLDSGGNLYGTTQVGGSSGNGTVFELSGTNHATFTTLISFTGSSGSYPGENPFAGLVLNSDGNLYGTTVTGGLYGEGTAFMISGPGHNSLTTLFTFSAGNGIGESGSLAIDSSGNLYGATTAGGLYGYGTVFELSGPNYSTYLTLVSFTGTGGIAPGNDPFGGLTFDGSGNLYGTTEAGGTAGDGTVFELSGPNHSTFTLLASLTGSSGSQPGVLPFAGISIDSSGNLYGTTADGGTLGDGSVFEISGANHSTFTQLVSFTGSAGPTPGQYPVGGITVDNNNLYGTTYIGGTSSDGTVFELAGANHVFSSLLSFTGGSGNYPGGSPYAGLILDGSDNLYGTTQNYGKSNDGTVFELSGGNHSIFTSLVSFTGSGGVAPGETPQAMLSMDSAGNLYGTTSNGGTSFLGNVFEISGPSYSIFTSLVSFTRNSGNYLGYYPEASLTFDSNGNLFGTTDGGGIYGSGTVFEIASAGVNNLVANSGAVTVGQPIGDGSVPSEYFGSVSVGSGASIAMTPYATGHLVLVTNTVSVAGSSSAWTGTIDLSNNDIDITAATLATVTNEIQQGYNGGGWSGLGITSSTAAGDGTHLTAVGVIQNNQSGSALFTSANMFDRTVPGAGDVLAKYSYYGDANLDGKVDGSDYSLIDNGYLNHLTGWFNGDFNYDGVVDGSDYTLIDNVFNTQGASLTAVIATPAGVSAVAQTAIANPLDVDLTTAIGPAVFSRGISLPATSNDTDEILTTSTASPARKSFADAPISALSSASASTPNDPLANRLHLERLKQSRNTLDSADELLRWRSNPASRMLRNLLQFDGGL